MEIDALRSELEQLFELDDLLELSERCLGLDPEAVGATAARGSYVRALTQHCLDQNAIEALCDAVISLRPEAEERLRTVSSTGLSSVERAAGSEFGEFSIVRKLGSGPTGVTYEAQQNGKRRRLKILRDACARDMRGLNRYLTFARVSRDVSHAGLPSNVSVGVNSGEFYIAQDYAEGISMRARLSRSGAMHINEVRLLWLAALDALQALHSARLTHGNLKLENLLSLADEGALIQLQDPGTDRLGSRAPANGHIELLSLGSPGTVAPEVLLGEPATTRSDVYALGTVLYELLTGEPPFVGDSSIELAVAHLTRPPKPASEVAPRGFVDPELDAYLRRLLNKDPAKRPENAEAAQDEFEHLLLSKSKRPSIGPEQLALRLQRLKKSPTDEEAALSLEAAVDEGCDTQVVTAALLSAFNQISDAPAEKLALGFRVGRLMRQSGELEAAESLYAELLELSPADQVAQTALEDLRGALGKHDELVEQWLTQADASEVSEEKAAAMAKIGQLYATVLDDKEQAVIAFSQALTEQPTNQDYADEIERLAASLPDAWDDVMQACSEALLDPRPTEDKIPLYIRAGGWYADRLKRFDLAVSCYQAVLSEDAANEAALDGLTQIYRQAQQFTELSEILMQRADAAASPAAARALRAEAAQVLDERLSDTEQAVHIYDQILEEDPSHEIAGESLAAIFTRAGDYAGLLKLVRKQADNAVGTQRKALLLKIAETYEVHLDEPLEALAAFRSLLDEDPSDLRALQGLDRLYSKQERFDELLKILEQQVVFAVTPRRKVGLYERIAAIYEEEFLDAFQAADTLETLLTLDPRNTGAMTNLARLYRRQERFKELEQLLERHLGVIEEEPKKLNIWLSLARVRADHLGDPTQAIAAYEAVLAIEPEHEGCLKALAELRESAGDADEALQAIDALAGRADSPAEKAEHYLRAAKLLETRQDLDGAIERYKLAMDATPNDSGIAVSLRAALLKTGDMRSAVESLEKEIAVTEADSKRAKLSAELAVLALEHLEDQDLAERSARQALDWDSTSPGAHSVLGQIAFGGERFLEACGHYEKLLPHIDAVPVERASQALLEFTDALIRSGQSELAVTPVSRLRELAPDDGGALRRIAEVTFEHGDPAQARDLYSELLERFDADLSADEKSRATYRHAESVRRTGDIALALVLLDEAADLDPSAAEPLLSLAEAHTTAEQWEDVWQTKTRLLDITEGDDRVELLLEMGDLAASKLGDRTRATKSLVAALDERPDDRKLLTRLMQLYSEDKDWSKLVDVVLKLADFVDDDKQKAKYLLTAGMVNSRELGDFDAALSCFERVLDLDPNLEKALNESVSIHRDRGDYERAEALLKTKMKSASQSKDTDRLLEAFTQLGELYKEHMGRLDDAVDAFEAAQTVDPDNRGRLEVLSDLYATNPRKYFDKGIAVQALILAADPYRADAYKALRRLYTETKNPDGAWCLCQALYVLKLAEPDEERFFKRMRSEEPAYAQSALDAEDWANELYPAELDPFLTAIFAAIEPAVVQSRGQDLGELGYDEAWALDLQNYDSVIGQTLNYAGGVMDVPLPMAFENTNDPGGLSFLTTKVPAVSIGLGALNADISAQSLAFIAGYHLTFHRPGFFLRQLVGTGTGLKSWLFAAIKLISPQFPVAADLEGSVNENVEVLQYQLSGAARDELARAVSKLLQSATSLDLKKWIAAVDATADRVGFLLSHDLETAIELIRESEGDNATAAQVRLKELVKFAVSPAYLTLRRRLQVNLAT